MLTSAPMIRIMLAAALAAAVSQPATAQQRSAYRYVDEQGNVVYSQMPPANKDANKVDISPAHRGREPHVPGTPLPREPDYRMRGDSTAGRDLRTAQQKQREEAEKKRLADLQAECNRNRGTDCSNPETLRYMESTAIPRRRY